MSHRVHIGQYIHDQIQILNQLDAEIRRIRYGLSDLTDPIDASECGKLLEEIQTARNMADLRLFELYTACRTEWAEPKVVAACEGTWKQLRDAWARFTDHCGRFVTAQSIQLSDLIGLMGIDSLAPGSGD